MQHNVSEEAAFTLVDSDLNEVGHAQARSSGNVLKVRHFYFRPNFHHVDRFALNLRGHTDVRGAAFSCLR